MTKNHIMKVLFVARAKSKNLDISQFIKSQGESLRDTRSIHVYYYPIAGSALSSYIRSGRLIREFVEKNNIDVIHAHYIICGWSVVLSRSNRPIVLSLMGTDAYGVYHSKRPKLTSRYLTLMTWMIQPFVDAIISKSKYIDSYVYLRKKANIIPNGIHLANVLQNINVNKTDLSLDPTKIHLLFLGNPKDPRKNIDLVIKAIGVLNNPDIELVTPYPISHNKVLQYMNATDVFIMSSYMEGSPNVVKEAMACNKPIVCTDVGDVRWLFGNEPGHFLSKFEPEEFAEKIRLAIKFSQKNGKTNGRQRITNLGLSIDSVAKQIVKLYEKIK